MKKVVWYFVGAALVGVALFMFMVGGGGHQSQVPNAARSDDSTAEPSVAGSNHRPAIWRLEPGTELVYRLDYRGEMEQPGAEGREASPQVLTGTLHIGVLAKTNDGYDVRVWIKPDAESGPDGETTWRALGAFVQKGVEGRLAFFGFDLHLSPEASLSNDQRAFWQSLFERSVAPIHPDVFGQDLTRTEKMGGVPIESKYQWSCQADCFAEMAGTLNLTRTIRAFSDADGRTVEGSAKITFRPELQGVLGIDVSTVETIGPVASGLNIRSHLKLSFAEEKQAKMAFAVEKGQSTSSSAKSVANDGDGNEAIDQAVVANLDEGQLLAELRQNQDLTELPQGSYLRLKSWIALHPESLPKFTQMLAGADASETVLRSYIKALGAVGHRGAQDAMVEILGRRAQDGDSDTVDLILTGFTLVKHPSPRAEKALRDLALGESPSLGRDRAKLVLGAIGHHLRQSSDAQDQGRALTLEKDLGELLSKAQDRPAKEALLGALGNLGPADIGLLTPYLGSEDTSIRARAYFALRFSPADNASQVLVDGLATQTSPVVRRDAIEALAMRPKDKSWLAAIEKVPVAQLASEEKLLIGRSISGADALDVESRRAVLEHLEALTKEPEVRQALGGYRQGLRY